MARTSTQTAFGYPRPETYEELLAVLASDGARLPKRLRAVAIHILQNPDTLALASISAVAEDIGVPPSTLVRFAKTFGYAGFSDFQEVFRSHLLAGLHRGQPADLAALPPVLGGLVGAAQASLVGLAEALDAEAFDAIAARIATSRGLYILGSKRAFPVVTYLALTFQQHGMRAILVDNVGASAQDLLATLGPGDCLLAVGFAPYNSPTADLTRTARDRGAEVLVLTDSPLSPLVELADRHLIVAEKSDSGYRTLAATMVVALGLVVAAMARRNAGFGPA
jgi:DNA-binding MurR/RpiR family transcriptional regulator